MFDTHRSTHGLAGNFGSAAAAACAAGLNTQQMRWVLSYASQQASGLASWQRDSDHIEKAFDFAGMPARNGVTAALLVQAGATGVDDVLSGADNFLEAFVPKNDASMLVDKLGERYEIMRTNIKKWTVGSPIQAPLDALEILMTRHRLDASQVKEITVRVATNEAKIVNNREIPDICLQHMMAVMLLDKTVTFQSAHDKARMDDPAVRRERAKVRLVGDEDLEKVMPRRDGIVEMTLADGRRVTEHVSTVKGTAENPMTREEVIAKASGLMTPILGASATGRLVDTILNIEGVKNVRELRPLLQRS
jgi:2-methylcitrate dehydratase PrpD